MERLAAATDACAMPPVAMPLLSALRAWGCRYLEQTPTPAKPVAVALSGGADSVALLLTAHAVWPGAVVAFHVNHGLQVAASQFTAVCEALCAGLGVPLRVLPVHVADEPGASLEAQARHVRYHALADAAGLCSAQVVLLGQHADDQAETVFLALTRGAGIPGLAAMGDFGLKWGVVFGRPFLPLRALALRECVLQQGVVFVDDPTNWDQRHTRNRIRHTVLPDIARHFPAVVDTLARTARHAAEASGLLDELAAGDLAVVGDPPRLKNLQALSRSRQANVLRHWLKICAGTAPSTAQMDELLSQIAHCTTRGHAISIKVSVGRVHRVANVLHYRAESDGPNDTKGPDLASPPERAKV
jgi:tRNA(Ile)-lysidine synthase